MHPFSQRFSPTRRPLAAGVPALILLATAHAHALFFPGMPGTPGGFNPMAAHQQAMARIQAAVQQQQAAMQNAMREVQDRIRRASGEVANATARLAGARNAEERAAITRTLDAWKRVVSTLGSASAAAEADARAAQSAEEQVRRRLDDPASAAREGVAREAAAKAAEEEAKASAAAPPDLNAWVASQGGSLAQEAWGRIPADVRGSGHANHGAFVGAASSLAGQWAPELRAQVGMNSRRDFARSKEGLIGLLNLRLGSHVERYTNRVRTLNEVTARMQPLREQIWGRLPGEAHWQRWSFDSEFNDLVSRVAGGVASRYPDGARSPAEQGAAMAYALGEAEGFAKSYADRKIQEKRSQEEAAERERRKPENCWRTWQTCAHNIFKCTTEKYDCKWIFCKLRTTCPWECTNWGANDPGCLIRNGWKAATGWLTDVWNKFTAFVQNAWRAIENLARTAWAEIQKAAKWVIARAEEARDWVGNQINNLGGILKRFKNLNLADLFADPVGTLMNLMGEDFLRELTAPINKLVDPLIKTASAEVQKVVESTLNNMDGTLRDKVLVPAARWALDKIFGASILANLREVAARVIGDVAAETRRTTLADTALRALAERKLDAFDTAMVARKAELAKLEDAKNTMLSKALVSFAKTRLAAFIQAQGTKLLRVVLKLLEAPIHAARVAACAAIDAIPVVGSTLSLAVGFVVKEGVTQIRNRVAAFLSKTIVTTFVEPLLGKLGEAFTTGTTAGRFESWIAPILEPVMPKLAEVRGEIGQIIAAQNRLTAALQAARKIAAAGPETKVEMVGGGR